MAQGENRLRAAKLDSIESGSSGFLRSSERWRRGVFFQINLHGPWSSDGHRVIERLLDSTITDGLIGVLDLDRNTLTLDGVWVQRESPGWRVEW